MEKVNLIRKGCSEREEMQGIGVTTWKLISVQLWNHKSRRGTSQGTHQKGARISECDLCIRYTLRHSWLITIYKKCPTKMDPRSVIHWDGGGGGGNGSLSSFDVVQGVWTVMQESDTIDYSTSPRQTLFGFTLSSSSCNMSSSSSWSRHRTLLIGGGRSKQQHGCKGDIKLLIYVNHSCCVRESLSGATQP